MIELPPKWIKWLVQQPETGMGYYVVTVVLKDGRSIERVVIDSGYISRIYGLDEIVFKVEDIERLVVTHDKWDFSIERGVWLITCILPKVQL